jgi:hypothetical protein
MLVVTRVKDMALAGVGFAAVALAGCTGPASAPSATATIGPGTGAVSPAPVTRAAAPSPSSAASPSPALARGASPSPSAPVASASATSGSGQATPAPMAEQPLTPETNPAGDIPDNQIFVTFTSSPGGYSLQVPEGWARTQNSADVRFANKLDGVQVTVTKVSTAPTAATVRPGDVLGSARAVQLAMVQDIQLPVGPAVKVTYSSNSDPDPVTNKQVRLENAAYLFYKNGKQANLTLWAPQGADNVDQWNQMAQSFRWQ